MIERYIKAKSQFEKRSIREKIMICVVSMVLIYLVWYVIFYDYIVASEQEINKKISDFKSQIVSVEKQIDSMSAMVGRDSTASLISQAESLKNENKKLDNDIVEETKKMVSPKDMATILKRIIQESEGLTLTNVESLKREPLLESKYGNDLQVGSDKLLKENKSTDAEYQIYTHGLKIEMTGGYFETVEFLKDIEKEKLNLIWDEISYEVDEYPNAKIKVIVHTLSLDKGWIGV